LPGYEQLRENYTVVQTTGILVKRIRPGKGGAPREAPRFRRYFFEGNPPPLPGRANV
jgi:hypothetical protein